MATEAIYGEKPNKRGLHAIIPIGDFRKQAYLDWLCTPPKERDPKTHQHFADTISVDRRTLQNWRDDREFVLEWEKRYLKTIGDPGRKQEIMNTLYKTATDGDDPKHVAAAKQYFEIEGSLRPQDATVRITKDPTDLTDDQLEDTIAARILQMKQRTGDGAS